MKYYFFLFCLLSSTSTIAVKVDLPLSPDQEASNQVSPVLFNSISSIPSSSSGAQLNADHDGPYESNTNLIPVGASSSSISAYEPLLLMPQSSLIPSSSSSLSLIPKEESEFKLLMQKATEGDPSAQTKLGRMFMLGRVEGGISQKNDLMAAEWFMAAKEKIPQARIFLIMMHMDGRVPYYRNIEDNYIVKCLKAAIENEMMEASTYLGRMYMKGRVVEGGKSPENDKIAFDLLGKAANQGKPEAQRNFGLMHMRGRGVEGGKSSENYGIGVGWIKLAAAQGDRLACNCCKSILQGGAMKEFQLTPQLQVELLNLSNFHHYHNLR
jgi:hypothetical protein